MATITEFSKGDYLPAGSLVVRILPRKVVVAYPDSTCESPENVKEAGNLYLKACRAKLRRERRREEELYGPPLTSAETVDFDDVDGA